MTPRVPSASRPRDLLLIGQPYAVSDEGLLSVLVGTRPTDRVRALLGEEGVRGLSRVSADELVALEGLGPATAARLLACVEFSRRAGSSAGRARPVISTPEDVVAVCGSQLRELDREHFWTLALNTKNRLLRIIEVSVGSLNASIVHPRELFKDAVRVSAASIVVVHNHPSGDPTPSGADIQLTRRIVKAGDVLGIEVLDHVVIGEPGSHASLRDLGMM
jgi:DNA repair protein RadC